ncbi:GTP pyrophosphokinase [Paenibacillus hexagrammi]|uniref:GTP pyrophosphokinase family protein n=1 Tax=Paenibacillus hexagrammi TaxID=2908839 RepID=A0ABY3SDU2_9BACL|nr:GTP pyrophosphokinase family protein [Paenibacillus sp. YPD9-1]UJF32163.1 GTP pyrophosphokinase family protein [Paenibacillus sp. YPD9-1]
MDQHPMAQLKQFKYELTRFMMMYKFALAEMETRIEILMEEFEFLHEYNPIENTKSRLKSPESIINKMMRKGYEISMPNIRENIKDIAGLRITCSFITDIYQIKDMLEKQTDLRIVEEKDYIKHQKANGYQSLHLLMEVPVFMSDGREYVCVEVQIRTIAMDFWASLEHKIYYKYNAEVPDQLLRELREAADSASALDRQMERLHKEISDIKEVQAEAAEVQSHEIVINKQQFALPPAIMKLFGEGT